MVKRSLHAVAPEQVPEQDGFCLTAPDSQWYENLKRCGSCKRLLELLMEDPTLIHRLGPEDMTVLHKGVRHGCVALVRFILVDVFDDRGHCKCSRHGADAPLPALTREQLLRKTCSYGSTAVNMAVVSGSPKMVVLLEWAIKMCRPLSGQTSKRILSEEISGFDEYRMLKAYRSRHMKKKGRVEDTHAESTSDTDHDLPVPEVRDDDLSMLYPSSSEVKSKVMTVIEGVLGNPGDEHREWMDMVKEWIVEDVDFEFVPLAHVFLHFLHGTRANLFEEVGLYVDGFSLFREDVTERIFVACGADGEDGKSGSMLKTLFNILDPQGRTFLHVAYESKFLWMLISFSNSLEQLGNISPSIKAECLNARDGAGRSIFHLMAIHNDGPFHYIDGFNVQSYGGELVSKGGLESPQDEKLDVFKKWCFPVGWNPNRYRLTPLDLAVIVNGRNFFGSIWPTNGKVGLTTCIDDGRIGCTSIQLAAALGRAAIIKDMLKHHSKFNSIKDPGLGNMNIACLPVIHCAASHGQVEAIQSILKFPIYDPMVQQLQLGTALHLLLDKQQNMIDLNGYHNALLCHVLPNSAIYTCVKNKFLKLSCKEDVTPRVYSSNEISCINLLLQAGIDIWTPHVETKEPPSPGPMANDEARKWWYEKVISEVVVLKTSVSYAANATSVVGALVATASFIGPFQPPLGYGDLDGFVRTDRSPLRVYLVCNSLSFYFSIASILMAVLPAIPMPKESLYDELLRSQRCLKSAAMMLLVSIICILISFSSASLAVVSPEWHERQVVVGCVIFGGVICVVVLVIYIIRLLRMLFHGNNRFRRIFARHMYF